LVEWTESRINHRSTEEGAKVRPTIDFLIKAGLPTYVFAGLEVHRVDETVLAHQWVTFSTAVEPKFRLLVFRGPGDGTDDCLALFSPNEIQSSIERLGLALSQAGTNDLSLGFHMVSVPLLPDWIHIPYYESRSRKDFLTCVLTAEAEPREVFTVDESLLEMTLTSFLQVDIVYLGESNLGFM
jgi:hypothetical protein